jgi:hypothetical protein
MSKSPAERETEFGARIDFNVKVRHGISKAVELREF